MSIPNSRALRPSRPAGLLCAAAVTALLAACGADAGRAAVEPEPPHGYVEGAEETAEVQPRLVVADADSGAVRVLDLVTGEVTTVGSVDAPTGIAGDGRFAYVSAADGTTRIVDAGAWTVDHDDHVHYYRAEIRDVGEVAAAGPVSAHSDSAVSAVTAADGAVTLLDRARLDGGEVVTVGGQEVGRHGPAVPYGEHVLAGSGGGERADGVEVRDRAGRPISAIDVSCPELEGHAVTRRGVVFGCADGALLVTEDDGAFSGEKIPYPGPVAGQERAREFRHRAGSSTLVAKAGDTGVWSLDVGRRAWTLVRTGPVLAVNTAGEGAPLLALTGDGVLHAYDAQTGADVAQTRLMAAPAQADPVPRIEIDTSRAYVNDPSTGTVHEIDYDDGLRTARTFDVGGRAGFVVETGR